jgi:NaMN:DMB phosphoribosyltransferase
MIDATDPAVAQAARARIDQLTKPRGSLGRIETLAVQLCAIGGGIPAHNFERRAILVGAGDHGVAADGVSAYPPEVTAQMVGGFLAGTAAINAFARAVRAEVYVANFGVRVPLAPHERLIDVNAGLGTANLAREPAIPRAALDGVLAAGRAVRRLGAGRHGNRQHDQRGGHRGGVHGFAGGNGCRARNGRGRCGPGAEDGCDRRRARALQRLRLGRNRERNGRL